MTISKGIKEKISALSDGELSDFETRAEFMSRFTGRSFIKQGG